MCTYLYAARRAGSTLYSGPMSIFSGTLSPATAATPHTIAPRRNRLSWANGREATTEPRHLNTRARTALCSAQTVCKSLHHLSPCRKNENLREILESVFEDEGSLDLKALDLVRHVAVGCAHVRQALSHVGEARVTHLSRSAWCSSAPSLKDW